MATSNGITAGQEHSGGITAGQETTGGIKDGQEKSTGIRTGQGSSAGIRTGTEGVRDYHYPSVCSFQKGERLRHSFYGEGSVLEVVREGTSEIIVVKLDDGSGSHFPSRWCPRFDPWREQKNILLLKYLS